jgi:hypothetical protein
MRKILYVLAVIIGLVITFVDSSPGWDDTGITAGLLLLSSAVLGFLLPRYPWLIALSVGIWIPLVSIFITHNYGGFIALIFSFFGAYAGMFIHHLVKKG